MSAAEELRVGGPQTTGGDRFNHTFEIDQVGARASRTKHIVVVHQVPVVRDWIEGAGEVLARRDGAALVHDQDVGHRGILGLHLPADGRRVEVMQVDVGRAPAPRRHVDPALERKALANGRAGGDVDVQIKVAKLETLADRGIRIGPAGARTRNRPSP